MSRRKFAVLIVLVVLVQIGETSALRAQSTGETADPGRGDVIHARYSPRTARGQSPDVPQEPGVELTVSGDSVAPPSPPGNQPPSALPITGPRIYYPLRMLQNRIEGSATVECVVANDGTTRDCTVIRATSGHFGTASLDFVRLSRFQPALRQGVPIEERHRWTFVFDLR